MIKKCIASILIILIFINSIGCSYNAVRKDDINSIEEAGKIKLTTVDNKEYILKNVTVTDSTSLINFKVTSFPAISSFSSLKDDFSFDTKCMELHDMNNMIEK